MKYMAITRNEALRISRRSGYSLSEDDGRTYYATNESHSEVWEYGSKKERDEAVKEGNK